MLIGIDGGGSTLRVVVVTPDLNVIGRGRGGNVNPNSAGREIAAQTLHDALYAALADAQIGMDAISAVGAGVAGTNNPTIRTWLHDTLSALVPHAPIYATHDIETALIGAHGARRGVIVAAGTGSAAFAVNDDGESLLVGGWGYLLGDEGSGAWMGLRALQAVISAADRGTAMGELAAHICDLLQISDPRALIDIVYQPAVPIAPRLARFAPLVLEHAERDPAAMQIVDDAAAHLAAMVETLARRLHMSDPPIAFGGGLLNAPNPISTRLQALLTLATFPHALYPPEIGAAVYARDHHMRKAE
jgi:N-acetylglucosamine kinase-like BadF-type ATPase